jgi:hypothetical protein
MDIEKILTVDLLPTLTDFLGDQIVFWECCIAAELMGSPIKNVLELGVYRFQGGEVSDFPGQSTKTLMILNEKYKFDRFISLDIDDCSSTIETCKKWVGKHGIVPKNHQFIQSNSLKFDVKAHFETGCDIIFIDTDHDSGYVKTLGYGDDACGAGTTYKEICHYAPHLSRNGKMFIHDTAHFYVGKQYGHNTEGAIEKFIDENPEFYFVEHGTNVHGLGEIGRK